MAIARDENNNPIPQYKNGLIYEPLEGVNGANYVIEKGLVNYFCGETSISSNTVDLALIPPFTVQKTVFLINDGDPIYIAWDNSTGTVGKTLKLGTGEGIDNDPTKFSVCNVKLVSAGSSSIRYKFVG